MASQLPDFHSEVQKFAETIHDEEAYKSAKNRAQERSLSNFFGLIGGRSVTKKYYDAQGNTLDVGVVGRFFRRLTGKDCLSGKELLNKQMNGLIEAYDTWANNAIDRLTEAIISRREQSVDGIFKEVNERDNDLNKLNDAVTALFKAQKPLEGKKISSKREKLQDTLDKESKKLSKSYADLIFVKTQIEDWRKIQTGLVSIDSQESDKAIKDGVDFIHKSEFNSLPQALKDFIHSSSPALQFASVMNVELERINNACEEMKRGNSPDEEKLVANLRSFHMRIGVLSENESIPKEVRRILSEKYEASYKEVLQRYLVAKNEACELHADKIQALVEKVRSPEVGLERLEQLVADVTAELKKYPVTELSQATRDELKAAGVTELIERCYKINTLYTSRLAEQRKALAEALKARLDVLNERAAQKTAEVAESSLEMRKREGQAAVPSANAIDDLLKLSELVSQIGHPPLYPIEGKTKEEFDKALKAYNILLDVAFSKRELQAAIAELNELKIFTMEVTRSVFPELSLATYRTTISEKIEVLNARKIFELLSRDEVVGVLKRGLAALHTDLDQERRNLARIEKDTDLLDDFKARLETKEGESATIDRQTNSAGKRYLDELGENELQEIVRYFSTSERRHFLSKEKESPILWSKLSVKDFEEMVAFLAPDRFLLGPSEERKQAFKLGVQYQSFVDLKGLIGKKEALPRDISLMRKCIDQVETSGSVSKLLEETKVPFTQEEWAELVQEKDKSSWSEAIESLATRYKAMLQQPENQAKSKQITKMIVKLTTVKTGTSNMRLNPAQINAKFDAAEFLLKEMDWKPDVKEREAAMRQRIIDRNKDVEGYAPFEKALSEIGRYSQTQASYERTATSSKAQESVNERLLEEKKVLDGQVEKLKGIASILRPFGVVA